MAVKDDDVDGGSSSALEEAFKFGWDQEDNNWDGELSPDPLDWVLDCDEEEDPYLADVLRFRGTSPGLGLKEEGLGIRAKGSWQI